MSRGIFRDSTREEIPSTEANKRPLRTEFTGSSRIFGDSQGSRALRKLEQGERLTDPDEIMAAMNEASKRSFTDEGKTSEIETSRQAFQKSRQELAVELKKWKREYSTSDQTHLVFGTLTQTKEAAKNYKKCYKGDIVSKEDAKKYGRDLDKYIDYVVHLEETIEETTHHPYSSHPEKLSIKNYIGIIEQHQQNLDNVEENLGKALPPEPPSGDPSASRRAQRIQWGNLPSPDRSQKS